MGMIAGQLLAFLKIGVAAFGVMAVIWGLVKYIENNARREIDGGDGPDTG